MKLFLLNAPRYLLYYIAMLEKSNEKGLLVFSGDFHLLDLYYETLMGLKKPPFVEILVLAENFHHVKKNDFHKSKHRRYGMKKLDELFSRYPVSEVITSNDGLFFNQYTLYLNRANRNTCLEDGMFNYLASEKKHSWYSRKLRIPVQNWFYKKVFFDAWQPSLGVGNNPYVEALYLTYPEKSHYSLNKPVLPLQTENFLYQSEWVSRLLTTFGLSEKKLLTLNYIILMDYHGRKQKAQHEEYVAKLREVCQKEGEKGNKVALKPHPRDVASYMDLKELENVILLPNVAFEFLLPYIHRTTVIIGGVSTSLMLAHMLSEFTVISVAASNFSENDKGKHLFEDLGIINIGNIRNIGEEG